MQKQAGSLYYGPQCLAFTKAGQQEVSLPMDMRFDIAATAAFNLHGDPAGVCLPNQNETT